MKKADLSRYRVLAFATHGLVLSDLQGLDQSALALANPQLAGDAENDGLLMLDEVLGLKLNANWVVLSTCNTAGADGRGGEAISGLGRGFFFAGASSLLVSNWAVEMVSARRLTTGLSRRQTEQAGITRAEALRQAMRDLMNDPAGQYRHPVFWAPFTLVGDGLL
ncbi:MAG: CHAT domain-containing protein [Candidatus Protistobacter heckmanni]|nr:CHAT domain-containing protein [Candidatus Protistobacter heckmanni]